MNLELDGKVALIAASSKGLGFEIAKTFAEEGAKIAICSRHLREIINAKNNIKKETGVEVFAAECDVTDENMIKTFVNNTIETLGDINILVNNAGGASYWGFYRTPTARMG